MTLRARAFTPANRIAFTLIGEAASKANSRKIVTIGGKPSSIKSAKARGFEKSALYQIPVWARQQLEGPVSVTMRMFYGSERPDLNESLVLDILQDRFQLVDVPGSKKRKHELVQKGVYRNDRQVREKHIFHGIDRNNPRVEIIVEALVAQQESLL